MIFAPYTAVRQNLASLLREEPDMIPTPYAYGKAWEILRDAHDQMNHFPDCRIVPDGRGGIEVYFNRTDRRVHLIVPAASASKPFLFTAQGEEKSFSRDAFGELLATRLIHFRI